jgi:alpha-beta hydrolase superfamily lysophospholipase
LISDQKCDSVMEPNPMIDLETPRVHTSVQAPQIEEAFQPSSKGIRIYSCIHPLPAPEGVVLISHGLGEHSGRYGHVVHHFMEANLACVRYDLRGHGRSDGLRGHTDSWSDLLDDLSMMFDLTRNRFPGVPILMLGHSLGGNIVANYCLRRYERASPLIAVVLSSPWFLLARQPPLWLVKSVQSLSIVWPRLPISARFRPRRLTRNPDAIDSYEHDPLVHRQISARLTSSAYAAGRWALKHAEEFPLPVLGTHGSADTITGAEGTRQFCERAPQGKFVLYEGLVHEPHNEPEWRHVVSDMRDWMLEELSQRNRSSSPQPGRSPIKE